MENREDDQSKLEIAIAALEEILLEKVPDHMAEIAYEALNKIKI